MPASIPTVKEICELIWQAEEEHDLLRWEVQGVRIWQVVRMQVYYALSQNAGVLETPQQSPRRSLRDKGGSLYRLFQGSLAHNPFLGVHACDVAVFEFPRHKDVGGEKVDIFTRYLAADLERDGIRYCLLDRSYQGAHGKDFHPRRLYLDSIDLLSSLSARAPGTLLGADDRRRARDVDRVLSGCCEGNLSLAPLIDREVKRFRTACSLYRLLFARLQPKEIYCVCAYGALAAMISAARSLGIPVTELQHGTFSRYHLGYSFPDRSRWQELVYFPDRLYAWSEFWCRLIDLPLPREKVVPFGFRYLDDRKRQYTGRKRTPGQMVVISQGAVSKRLAELILEHLPVLRDRRIVYKLHPGEYERWRENPALLQLDASENVAVVCDADLYGIFAESEVQVGVFSTAVYEGMEFGLQTVIADLPGVEYMEALLASGEAIPFRDFIEKNRGHHPP